MITLRKLQACNNLTGASDADMDGDSMVGEQEGWRAAWPMN